MEGICRKRTQDTGGIQEVRAQRDDGDFEWCFDHGSKTGLGHEEN